MASMNRQWTPSTRRMLTAITPFAFLLLSACVESEIPLVSEAKPLFGQQGHFQLYDLSDGAAHRPVRAAFRWDGGQYVVTGPEPSDRGAFTTHEFEGRDLLIQVAPDDKTKGYRYALARKLAEGVYLYFLVEENDADETTRKTFCASIQEYSCWVATREGLLAFARASAAKSRDSGNLAIIVADDEKK